MRILSVDDNAENRYLVEAVVHAHGHDVVSARNGREALAELAKQSFDLVITDILMPEMDGFQLCRELKRLYPNTPLIFYTATYTERKDEELGLALGASRFVVKPLEPQQFMAVIDEVMRERQSGTLPAPAMSAEHPEDFLKAYNERLVRKLERKVAQLEAASRDLNASLMERDREIAQRKEAEEALLRSQEQLRHVWEQSKNGMRITDAEGLIVRVNPAFAEMFDKPASELEGQPLTCCLAPENGVELIAAYRRDFAARTIEAQFEAVATRWDGRRMWFEWSHTFIDIADRPILLSILLDITARKRMEEERHSLEQQLYQAQKLESVGRLAGGVAHDFNNLLTVINGYTDLILRRASAGDPTYEALSQVRIAGERAGALTRQLLAFSRKQMVEPKHLHLNAIVSDAVDMFRRLVGAKIVVKTQLEANLPPVVADEGQMHQLLMNLVVNARDAMPDGGVLTIATQQLATPAPTVPSGEVAPGPCAVLTVSDTGVGMDKETLQYIFEPFFTTKLPGEGTGLGLSTAYGIVRQAGGWIAVESQPGRGTKFSIYLPVAAATESVACAVNPRPSQARGSETILVVEDDDEVRKVACAMLRGYGYSVLEAHSGEAAVERLERDTTPIHILLTDIQMAGMSGRQLARRFELLRPKIPVLYMSGSADESAGLDFIPKPFDGEVLAAKIRRLLDDAGAVKILVVDDDEAIRHLFKHVLTEARYAVSVAANGREAVAEFQRSPVDLVITDLVMPDQEGIETIQTLRRRSARLPIIAVSGAFGGTQLKVAQMLGADVVLSKPVSPDRLLGAVAELLAKRRN